VCRKRTFGSSLLNVKVAPRADLGLGRIGAPERPCAAAHPYAEKLNTRE
jgi:hypothetical protein